MAMLADIWRFHGWALLTGCVLDWILGDPYGFPHPVRLMGSMIGSLEGVLREKMSANLKRAGFLLVVIMVLFWTVTPLLLLVILWMAARAVNGRWAPWILFAAESVACYQLLAARCLCSESMKVCRFLEKGDTEGARSAVSMIVGRDTRVLDQAGIARAAVETVAENASDGVIAPFLFMALLGPAGGMAYKAINTMDSMVGYTSGKYILFGRAAAKLDDAVNFLPARLSGILLVLGAWICPGTDGKNAWRIFLRDRRKHASPNSAHGEAACAGALHLRLAGDAWYFGELHKKPYIGEDDRPVEPEDIRRANRLMFLAEALLMAVLAALLLI